MAQTYYSQTAYLTQTVNNAPQNLTLTVPTGSILSNLTITTTQTAAPGLSYTLSVYDSGGAGKVILNRIASSTPNLISGVRDVLVTPDKPILLGNTILGLSCTQASTYTTHIYLSYKSLNQNGLNFTPNYIQSVTVNVTTAKTVVLAVPPTAVYKILSIYSTAPVSGSTKITCTLTPTPTGGPLSTTPFCEATLTGVSGALLQTGTTFTPFFMQGTQGLVVSSATYPVNVTITYMVVS